MQKVLCDFEIKSDHTIAARQPELVIVNKKKEPGHCRPGRQQSNNKRKRKER